MNDYAKIELRGTILYPVRETDAGDTYAVLRSGVVRYRVVTEGSALHGFEPGYVLTARGRISGVAPTGAIIVRAEVVS